MAGFASQAALRSHYEDLIDETEQDISNKLTSAVSWFKQVVPSLTHQHSELTVAQLLVTSHFMLAGT